MTAARSPGPVSTDRDGKENSPSAGADTAGIDGLAESPKERPTTRGAAERPGLVSPAQPSEPGNSKHLFLSSVESSRSTSLTETHEPVESGRRALVSEDMTSPVGLHDVPAPRPAALDIRQGPRNKHDNYDMRMTPTRAAADASLASLLTRLLTRVLTRLLTAQAVSCLAAPGSTPLCRASAKSSA